MLDVVAIVAVYAVISDAVVDGCGAAGSIVVHVTLRGPAELLGAIEARVPRCRDRSIWRLRGRLYVHG